MFRFFKNWWDSEDGIAAMEAALIFPVMLTLLLGTYDIGNAILANQKAIRASQVVADLITRNRNVTQAQIDEAIEAGRLALEPMDGTSFGVDLISIAFDDASNPQIRFRETVNMSPIGDVNSRVASLAAPNEGVVVVAVQYDFEPLFAGFIVNEIAMQEIAFGRGRKSAVVNLQ